MALNEHAWQRKLARKRKNQASGKSRHRMESNAAAQALHLSINDSGNMPETVALVSYEITDEPLPDASFDQLPVNVQEQINSLHDQVLKSRPKAALAVLEALIKQYPDVTQLHNYLFITHYNLGKKAEASRVLQETVRRFPDYLFARISLAEQCLNQGEADKVKDIFEGKFDLKLLYPKRERFHYSEVLGLECVVARYFHAQGNQVLALKSYNLMCQLDPTHPSTRLAGRILLPWRFSVWLRDKLKRLGLKRQQ